MLKTFKCHQPGTHKYICKQPVEPLGNTKRMPLECLKLNILTYPSLWLEVFYKNIFTLSLCLPLRPLCSLPKNTKQRPPASCACPTWRTVGASGWIFKAALTTCSPPASAKANLGGTGGYGGYQNSPFFVWPYCSSSLLKGVNWLAKKIQNDYLDHWIGLNRTNIWAN